MFTVRYTAAELSDRHFRRTIPPKWEAYYFLLDVGRSIGYRRTPKCAGRWVARLRVKTGNFYREKTMGLTDDFRDADGVRIITFAQAKAKALEWFDHPDHLDIRVDARPRGWRSDLDVCPIGDEYTVAHVMRDYVNWKRDFGAPQSFHACVSRANVYILPLIGTVLCKELTSLQLRSVLLHVESSVLQRAGGTKLKAVDPKTLDPEVRRKRRITANNTFTDLRSALNMAYSEDKIQSNAS